MKKTNLSKCEHKFHMIIKIGRKQAEKRCEKCGAWIKVKK